MAAGRPTLPIAIVLLSLALAGCGSSGSGSVVETSDARTTASTGGTTRAEPGTGEASCALTVSYTGHTYLATGVEIAPPQGEVLGKGTLPGCGDSRSEQIEVAEIPGVSPSVALVFVGRNDVVLVRDDVDGEALPSEISHLLRASECDPSDVPIELDGPWLGILNARGGTEVDLVPPYDLEIYVERASSPRYERSHITVRVSPELGRPLSRDDVRSSLWRGGTISLTVACRDGRYIARQLDAYPPA
jgi:hypothetical protein